MREVAHVRRVVGAFELREPTEVRAVAGARSVLERAVGNIDVSCADRSRARAPRKNFSHQSMFVSSSSVFVQFSTFPFFETPGMQINLDTIRQEV